MPLIAIPLVRCLARRVGIVMAVEELAVGAHDQLRGGLVAGEFGEARAQRASFVGGSERAGDRAEAPARVGERHVRHRAQKLVAGETDDQVVGAQVLGDQRDDALEKPVAGVVTFAVVELLQSDSVGVGEDERAAGPAAAVEFAVKVGQARRSRASPGQRVDLGDRECVCERLAICERLQAVTGALLAVCRRGLSGPGRLARDAPRPARGSPWRACVARRRGR